MKKSTQSCFSKQKNLLRRTSGSLRSCPPNTLFSLSGNVHGVLVLVTPFLFLTFFSSPLLRVQSFSSIEKEFGQNAQQRFYCVKVMLVYSIAFFDNAVLKMLYWGKTVWMQRSTQRINITWLVKKNNETIKNKRCQRSSLAANGWIA